MIPEHIIDQIQEQIDIAEVIGAVVPLKRAGRNFKGLCPFHNEKTPSFMVNPEKGIFHCFGCGVGGNVFTFLMKYEGVDFPEAAQTLAEKTGIVIPKTEQVNEPSRTQRLFYITQLARDFFRQQLRRNKGENPGVKYFKQRGITSTTAQTFSLGWVPEGWDHLLLHTQKNGIQPNELLAVGLVIAKDSGGFYDRFRDRVIFPICDLKGRYISFGGRVLDDSQPKYLNGPETILYNKGRHLYGLFQARDAIRQAGTALIVEGYMDVVMLAQHGITNVVASLGTSLTNEQIRLLKRFTREVVMLYDADAAGEDATMRGLELLLEEEMSVKILRLPKGEDPDSFIRSNGLDRFRQLLEQSTNLFDYLLARALEKHDSSQPEGVAAICQMMLRVLMKVKDAVLQSMYVTTLSQRLKIDEASLRIELRKLTQQRGIPQKKASIPRVKKSVAAHSLRYAERMLLALMLEHSDYIEGVKAHLVIDDFADPEIKHLVQILFDHMAQGKTLDASQLVNFAQNDSVPRLLSEAICDVETLEDKTKAFLDCLRCIKRHRIEERLAALQQDIGVAQEEKNDSRMNDLIGKHAQLTKELHLFK